MWKSVKSSYYPQYFIEVLNKILSFGGQEYLGWPWFSLLGQKVKVNLGKKCHETLSSNISWKPWRVLYYTLWFFVRSPSLQSSWWFKIHRQSMCKFRFFCELFNFQGAEEEYESIFIAKLSVSVHIVISVCVSRCVCVYWVLFVHIMHHMRVCRFVNV